ncbi:MAG: UDP-3-O-acyl-N-acetylglucosamine deacetylase [Oligoflexia bacterium]|nr:UDP-3-O-acyl-N-acetylglucosamine deacetylase [Oligoflexia bacterium]MBF0367663.1 UDP-3-O-acyl-N-acetylglucosamine deacetylase [Oligoflexia bacterium]
MLYQRTLAKKVEVSGLGLHSGKKVSLSLHPAEADFGIRFKRTDIIGSPIIKADACNVGATENATTLVYQNVTINTVEHLLAVLYGMGINNAYCEVDGPEIPIMDGSGASFIYMLKEAGIAGLNRFKKFLVILDSVRVEFGDRWAQIEPSPRLVIDSSIEFAHPQIKKQQEVFDYTCENFIAEIGRARTFGMLRDVDMLKRKGLARGGSLDNAIVLDDYKVINTDGLRFHNEFVKHKILDTLGDMSLLGYDLAGKITTYKSGHHLNNLLCRKILENKECYKIVPANFLCPETTNVFGLPWAVCQI